MPRIVESATVPDKLKPYQFHGVEIDYREGSEQAIGTCPWCSRENKFRVKVETGQWTCLVCKTGTDKGGGNDRTFLRLLHERSAAATTDAQLGELRLDRRLVSIETLRRWGVVQSEMTGEWLVPGYGADGKLQQLYKYVLDRASNKKLLKATWGLSHQLLGVGHYEPAKPIVFLCEGPWDAMALEEVLASAKDTGSGLMLTSNVKAALGASVNVLAVPGCGSFHESWLGWFAGKRVYLVFDSDHPKRMCRTCQKSYSTIEHDTCPLCHNPSGADIEPAGYSGLQRTARLLSGAETPPAEISYLVWGESGYDPEMVSGYDVRDALTAVDGGSGSPSIAERVKRYAGLRERFTIVPSEWLAVPGSRGKDEIDCRPCESWTELVTAWRKALKWTDGLDCALSVMLSCVTSTKAVGDQLWCKILAPPSCGKSVLCEALSVNKKYIVAKSTIRGFHSGFKSDKDGAEDNSLIAQMYGKTLVTKDGDTLLQSPNLGQILSEARDLYDSTSRTHYRNKMSKDYMGVRMTWILCGTSSLRLIDSSELGERFLDCVIMDHIDDDLEDEILWRVVNRADLAMNQEADGKLDTQHDPEMTRAMQLSGGYVTYLRENAQRLLSAVESPEAALRKCVRLGKFVAYMRARPSTRQDETAEREFAARLVSQMVRLAKCLAVVLNRKSIDAEVLRRVRKVALDTARGRTLELARYLYPLGEEGAEAKTLAHKTGHSEEKERLLLRFLRHIEAVDYFTPASAVAESGKLLTNRPRWRLTPRMMKLYRDVMEE